MRKPSRSSCIIALVIAVSMIAATGVQAETISRSLDLYDEGKDLYEDGKYGQAVQYFEKAVQDCEKNPMTVVYMYYMADSYEKMGNENKALSTYKKLVATSDSEYWTQQAKKQINRIKR